jgi:hypothetical protein
MSERSRRPVELEPATRTPVTRLIRRVVDLAGAHKPGALYPSRRAPCEKPTEGARLGAPGVAGCNGGFGFSRFATAFMNNPGQASGSTLIDPATNWLHREEGLIFRHDGGL